MRKVLEFLLGAFLGGITSACIFALCVGVCTAAIRPAKNLGEAGIVLNVGFIVILIGTLIGSIVGVRKEILAQPGEKSVTKPE